MKAVMVMYDSLRLQDLPCYGGTAIELPNFKRLAEHTAVFDNSYVCSMPCMPARRELHTGRANFLHRSWGPLEPFDDSMPEILKCGGRRCDILHEIQYMGMQQRPRGRSLAGKCRTGTGKHTFQAAF